MQSYVVLREIMISGNSLQKGDILVFDPNNHNRLTAYRNQELVFTHTDCRIAIESFARSRQIESIDNPATALVNVAKVTQITDAVVIRELPVLPVQVTSPMAELDHVEPTPTPQQLDHVETPDAPNLDAYASESSAVSAASTESFPVSEAMSSELNRSTGETETSMNPAGETEAVPVQDKITMKVTRGGKKKVADASIPEEPTQA